MKQFVFIFLFLFLVKLLNAQADSSLSGRLQAFMKANADMNYEGILDFTYPKIFKLAPRELMLEEIRNTFENEEMTVKMDSLRVDSIYPVFTIGDGHFARVRYSFIMIMHFLPEDDPDEEEEKLEAILEGMKIQFGENNVRIQDGAIRIAVTSDLVAVKDEYATDWCFMDILNNKEMNDLILDKEVLKQLAIYQ